MLDVFFNVSEPLFLCFFFMIVTEREREADTGRGRSRLHAPGARRGIRSRVSRIAPWAKGRRQTTAPPRDPRLRFFNKDFIYLFMRDNRARGRDTGRGRSRLPAGSPMWGSMPGPRDHDLSQRHTLNCQANSLTERSEPGTAPQQAGWGACLLHSQAL